MYVNLAKRSSVQAMTDFDSGPDALGVVSASSAFAKTIPVITPYILPYPFASGPAFCQHELIDY